MKFKFRKLSAAELVKAARGEFEVDITDELKALQLSDDEARALGIMTKSVEAGDSRIDGLLEGLKSDIAALVAAFTAFSTANNITSQTLVATAETLKPDGTVLKAIDDLRAEVNTIKADVKTMTEKAAQALATAEAVKGAQDKRPENALATGAITPEMITFLQGIQQAAAKSTPKGVLEAFDSVED